ncbi:MAG: KOW motif-containing protein [Bacteroidales bacterium]|nr:KOW motif-containing protein [Bacteroidales bacterium]
MTTQDDHWHAIRIIDARRYILSFLETNSIETFIPMASGRPLLGSIVFLRCSERFLFGLKSDFYSRIAVYRDSARTGIATISDAEMDNFRMVVNIKGQEYIPLTITNPQFLKGSRVRVLDGPFKGAVGVVRRIKGDRRLVVSVSGICAVATSFIRPELLEPVSEEEDCGSET